MARDDVTSTGKFGVVIPVYNEPRLALLLARFDFNAAPHVVVVDDGSSDGSTVIAGNYPVTLLKHERRKGVGASIRTGLSHLKQNGCAIGVVMAGNNKDDPRDIPSVVAAVREGADYVQGSRYVIAEKAKDTPFKRRVITRGVAFLWSLRFGRRLTDVTNGFRAYKLAILDDRRIDLDQEWLNRYELEYYLHYKVLSLGYAYAEVSVAKRYPTDGLPTSKIKLRRDGWSLLRPLVLMTLGFKS